MRRIGLALALAWPLLAAASADELAGQPMPEGHRAEANAEPPAGLQTGTEAPAPVDPEVLEILSTFQGQASFYGKRLHGRRTASGERHDAQALTAAHPSLPFGTWVRVQSLGSGREVSVRINDRGPFTQGRVIDLSYAAAKALGMLQVGTQAVQVQVLGLPRR